MAVSLLDMRGQTDFASSIVQCSASSGDKAIVFVRANSCEYIKKTAISYIYYFKGFYHIYSQVLDKPQNDKQAVKQGIYRAVQNAKALGAKELNVFLVNDSVFTVLERNIDDGVGKSLKFDGSMILIEDQAEIAMNIFLGYFNEIYKGYIPPQGYKLKTKSIEDALRWFQFLQGDGSFENHVEVPQVKEKYPVYVELTIANKSTVIKFSHLCWMVFDWLMRQKLSRGEKVSLKDILNLSFNYFDYFGNIDASAVRQNKMGLHKLELSSSEKNLLLNRLIDFSEHNKFEVLNSNISIYLANTPKDKEFSHQDIINNCSEMYQYHLSLVRFKSELIEQESIQPKDTYTNIYHALANALHPELTDEIYKQEDSKKTGIFLNKVATYTMLLKADKQILIDEIWDMERRILIEEASMMINGLDLIAYYVKVKNELVFFISNELTGEKKKIPKKELIELLKEQHTLNKKSALSLDVIFDIIK